MLKSLKLRKLKKMSEMHLDAAIFCLHKSGDVLRKGVFLTKEGKETWHKYYGRFNIHLKAYDRFRAEYDKFNQSH